MSAASASVSPLAVAPWRSSGSSALVTRLTATTLTSNIRVQSSGSLSSTDATPNAPPALLTSAWIGPSSRRKSRSASTCAWSVRSAVNTSAPVSAASCSRRSVRRATPTTSQPRERNRRTVAAPMPELAPVTTTRRALTSTSSHSNFPDFPTVARLRWPSDGYGNRSGCRAQKTRTGVGQRPVPDGDAGCHRPRNPAHHLRRRLRTHRLPVHLRVPHAGLRRHQRLLLPARISHLTADEEGAHRHPAALLHHGDDLDAGEVPRRGQPGVQPVPAVMDAVVPARTRDLPADPAVPGAPALS